MSSVKDSVNSFIRGDNSPGSDRGGCTTPTRSVCHGKPAGNPQLQQLFARINQEVEEQKPANIIHFVVDFLCKHYPEHLQGFASVWNGDPDLVKDRLLVIEFFKHQKLPNEIAAHFTNAGFDTLETLCTLAADSLDDIERFNQTRWLPGHKVRLQQTFSDIAGRVRQFREEKDNLMRALRGASYCHHPQLITKPNLSPSPSIHLGPCSTYPALSHTAAGLPRVASPLAITSCGGPCGASTTGGLTVIPCKGATISSMPI